MTASEKISALRALRSDLQKELRNFYTGSISVLICANLETAKVWSLTVAGQGTTIEDENVLTWYKDKSLASSYIDSLREDLTEEQKDLCREKGWLSMYSGSEDPFLDSDVDLEDFWDEVEGWIDSAEHQLNLDESYAQ